MPESFREWHDIQRKSGLELIRWPTKHVVINKYLLVYIMQSTEISQIYENLSSMYLVIISNYIEHHIYDLSA